MFISEDVHYNMLLTAFLVFLSVVILVVAVNSLVPFVWVKLFIAIMFMVGLFAFLKEAVSTSFFSEY